ncbi:hypothetical protein WEI85_00610 [Actinomycetes bacterium KLBMP 9797]
MYRHQWAYQPSHPDYVAAWPTILDDTRRIIGRVRQVGIVIAGPDGYGRPTLDNADGIELNGDATTDLDGEAFRLLAPLPAHPRGTPTATAACSTGRKPYDLAVTAVLLRCTLLLPHAFAIASDGAWDREWVHGATRGAAAPRLGARSLVAELFDAHPTGSPLHPSVAGIRLPDAAAPPPADDRRNHPDAGDTPPGPRHTGR